MWASFIGALLSLLSPATYGSELEKYIVSRNPQSVYDVEKYTLEFQHKGKWI
jgi:hypothetical protein